MENKEYQIDIHQLVEHLMSIINEESKFTKKEEKTILKLIVNILWTLKDETFKTDFEISKKESKTIPRTENGK